MDVIVSHVNADSDSLGALVGASLLYPDSAAVLTGGESPGVREFLALHREALDLRDASDIDPETITRLVVVDTASRRRLGRVAEWLDLPGVEVHLYDHHLDTEPSIRADLERLEPWGSASTIVAHEMRAREIPLTPIQATTMLLGIYEDTGRLTFASTRAEDLEAAAWLMRQGADLGVVERFTHRTLTPEQRTLLRQVLEALEIHEVAGVEIAIACAPPGPYVEDSAVVASVLLESGEADGAFLLLETDGMVYVIGRSRSDAVDIGGALRDLGGGGHRRAASAQVKEQPMEEVRARLLAALEPHVTRERTAREIMSYPVRTISPEMTVAEARRRMIRYGHSGLLVLEDGEVAGIATRKDVDKARHHRLDHAPIRGYMTRHVRTVPPETPVSELEEEMIRHDIGRLPVVAEGKVLGIVTRTDVLRALHGARYVRGMPKPEEESVAQLIRERLPASIQRVLEEVGELAVREEAQVFVVGGILRDLLLNVRNLDLDLLVEPDGVALAQALAAESGGEFKDKRFGTAAVTLPDAQLVEFATARTEAYPEPGALPEVEPSSVVDDLRRRDFTINAMAAALRPERFGELLDPFGGRSDLERRRIRVLHNLSFTEDPTRIFRAVRFETRFHFRMDPHTEALARLGIRDGVLGRISPDRLRKELLQTLREPRCLGAIERLEELGVLEWLAPGLQPDEPLLQSLPGAVEWWKKEAGQRVDASYAHLTALLAPLGADSAAEVVERRLHLAPQAIEAMRDARNALADWKKLLAPGKPSEIVGRLKNRGPQALALLRVATNGDREAQDLLERYAREWRDTKLEITGEDLKALGFPADRRLGLALAHTLEARLDGKVRGREAELAYAETLLRGSKPQSAPAATEVAP